MAGRRDAGSLDEHTAPAMSDFSGGDPVTLVGIPPLVGTLRPREPGGQSRHRHAVVPDPLATGGRDARASAGFAPRPPPRARPRAAGSGCESRLASREGSIGRRVDALAAASRGRGRANARRSRRGRGPNSCISGPRWGLCRVHRSRLHRPDGGRAPHAHPHRGRSRFCRLPSRHPAPGPGRASCSRPRRRSTAIPRCTRSPRRAGGG